MRYIFEKPHPDLQKILLALLFITVIAIAISGCPLLGNDKHPNNNKVTSEIRSLAPFPSLIHS
ncbi:MAG TPA: hypothetical protein VLH08_00220 [Acidobacteriota bacterium]|nr:hypothetical protein [Acidobacteriota bacterium]